MRGRRVAFFSSAFCSSNTLMSFSECLCSSGWRSSPETAQKLPAELGFHRHPVRCGAAESFTVQRRFFITLMFVQSFDRPAGWRKMQMVVEPQTSGNVLLLFMFSLSSDFQLVEEVLLCRRSPGTTLWFPDSDRCSRRINYCKENTEEEAADNEI